MDDGLFNVVALEALPHFVEDVQHIVHGVCRVLIALQKTVEQAASSILSHKSRKRLRFNESWHDHLGKPLLSLLHPGVVDVVFEAVEVMLDNGHQTLVVFPVKVAACTVNTGTNALQNITLGDANERVDFVHVGKPEDAGLNCLVSLEVLQNKESSEQ